MNHLLSAFMASLLLIGCSAISELSSDLSGAESTSTDSSSAEIDEVNEAPEASTEAESTEADSAETAEDEEGVNQKNVKLVIRDQTTAGQIVVEEVATARDGWVSIHKSNQDGGIVLPDSIGEARVDSGESKDVIVDLWEAPYIEEKLWVLLHIDSGDRGTYEFPGEDVAVKKDGKTMARSFYIKEDSQAEDE